MPTYSATILAETGLVAYWRLGEASGNPQDSAGTNHVTTTNGTPTYSQSGALAADTNTAILFDGATESFQVPDATALDLGNGPLSLEVWVKRGVVGTGQHAILSKDTGAYRLHIGPVTADRIMFSKDNTAFIVESRTGITDTTTWHHIAATKSGAVSRLYLDGFDVTGTVTDATLVDTASVLSIGQFTSGTPLWFNGSLDEVAIYSVALTAAQVGVHYSVGVGGGVMRADMSTFPKSALRRVA